MIFGGSLGDTQKNELRVSIKDEIGLRKNTMTL